MTKLERLAAIATVITVIIAAIALIPDFGSWLYPRESSAIPEPSITQPTPEPEPTQTISETATQPPDPSPTQSPPVADLSPSDYGELLYEENFNTDDITWSFREGSIIQDGELTIHPGTDAKPYSDDTYSDFIFETAFRHINPQGDSEFVVYLRFQVPPCAEWNCSIQIWASGDWQKVGARRIEGTEVSRILRDAPAPQLDPTAWNKLTVVVKGDTYEIYVNDAFVQSFTDSTYRSGKFVFSSAPGATAIDYVRIYALP